MDMLYLEKKKILETVGTLDNWIMLDLDRYSSGVDLNIKRE